MKPQTLCATAALVVAALCVPRPTTATTYNDINCDGSLSDWAADEFMEQELGKDLRVTWNANNLYIAISEVNWTVDGDLFIYLGVDSGGSSTTADWSGTHTLPFNADYAFTVENNSFWRLQRYTEGVWQDTPYTGAVSIGQITEIELPLSDIGSPSAGIELLIFAQWEAQQNVWGSWPTMNPASNSGPESFTHFYHFPSLPSGVSPSVHGTIGPITVPTLSKWGTIVCLIVLLVLGMASRQPRRSQRPAA